MARSADFEDLTRRERQIMDILFELGEATAHEVLAGLPDPPSYSAVRALLAKLERKGHVRHSEKGLRYVYRAVVSRRSARQSAVSRLVHVFFDGSVEQAVTGLLDQSADALDDEALDRMAEAIEQARKDRSKQ